MHAAEEGTAAVDELSNAVGPDVGLGLPNQPPAVVRLGEVALSVLAALLGVVLGLAASVAINTLSAERHPWVRLFALDSAQAVIPIVMLCMFFWGLMVCLLRWARMGALLRISDARMLDAVARATAHDAASLATLSRELAGSVSSGSPLLRRVRAVLQQWQVHADLSAALALSDQHAIADEDAVRRGFATVKTFVWALPVLGLIGTVVGIASAVAEFSGFLGTQVEDVTAIKQSLVSVTGGLAFAFSVTILGLAASLLLMLPAAALQSKEERFYGGLQTMLSEVFLPTLQRRFPLPATSAQPMDGFRDAIAAATREVVESVGTQLMRIGEGLMQTMKDATTPSLLAHERSVGNLLEQMSGVQQGLAASAAALNMAAAQQSADLGVVRKDLLSVLQALTESGRTVAGQVGDLVNMTSKTVEAQRNVEAGLVLLSALPSALENVAKEIDRLVSLRDRGDAAAEQLAQSTNRVLDAQANLLDAMARLDATGLTKVLASMIDRLEEASGVLKGFQEPMVFQAVPVRLAANAQASDGSGFVRDRT